MKKYYYWSTELPHKQLVEYFERFQAQYASIPGIEIEDWTDTNGFLVRVPDTEASKLPFNYPEGANPAMTRTEINEIEIEPTQVVNVCFVYRFDEPTIDLEARSKQARADFQKQFAGVPGLRIVGFGLGFFACSLPSPFAENLPKEFQGMKQHTV